MITASNIHSNVNQRAGLVPACLLLILFCTCGARAIADSTAVAIDSLVAPYASLGRISMPLNPTQSSIGKVAIRTTQYRSLPELITRNTFALPRSLGGFAQHNTFTFTGEDNAGQSVSMNGRQLFEPWSSQYHLEQISVEGIERIEVLHGTDAVGLGASMALQALNMQAIIYNSAKPITRLWYAQGGGELVAGDVTFSQNVASNLNATIGIRRNGAVGRYARTDFDVWNVRTSFRWSPASTMHVQFSYNLSSLNTDQWGGVQAATVADFSETSSLPVYSALRDASRRHDVDVTATFLGGIDSTTVLTATAYVSTADLLRQRSDSLMMNASDTTGWQTLHGRIYGSQLRLQQRIGSGGLSAGISGEYSTNQRSVYAQEFQRMTTQGWLHTSYELFKDVEVRAAVRAVYADTALNVGAGIATTIQAFDNVWFTLDASTASRQPTPAEGLQLHAERHALFYGSMLVQTANINANLMVFHRRITDALSTSVVQNSAGTPVATLTQQGGERLVSGIMLHGRTRLWNIEVTPTVRAMASTLNGVDETRVPRFSGQVSIAYVYETTANSVRLGTTLGWFSPIASQGYSPLTWTPVLASMQQPFVTNGVDVHLVADVGNASIRIAWENLLGTPWFSVVGYPEITRNFRLSLSWSFFD